MRRLGRIRRGRRALFALMVMTVLALAAFGGALVAGAGAKSSTTRVGIDQAFKYRPGTIRVKAGTEIAFENESSYTHTATDKGAFDTGHIKPGATKQILFKRKGTYVFHCTIHPFMTGKVIVE